MKVEKLDKRAVDGLQAAEKPYVAWCGALPGFGVSVRPSGSKSFIAQYDFGGRRGTTRRVTIGAYGKPWTVDHARKEASAILIDAKHKGIDRAATKREKRAELTVAELCDEYVKHVETTKAKRASTMATDRGSINRHIIPQLGKMKLSDLKKHHVRDFYQSVAIEREGPTANIRKLGGQGAANRTLRLLGAIFSYAVERDLMASNPRTGVKFTKADEKRKRYLSVDEFRRLGATLHEAETSGLPWNFNEGAKAKHRPLKPENQRERIDPKAIAAMRLLLFTGCRLSEILTLKWDYVHFDRGVLALPESKTGAKDVHIGAAALEVLADLRKRRTKDHPFVIEGSEPKKPRSDIKKPWARVVAHAKLVDFRIHDMRHSYASIAVSNGMGLHMVSTLLGHASTDTTERYAHTHDDAFSLAANAVSSMVKAAMNGEIANVVPIRKSA